MGFRYAMLSRLRRYSFSARHLPVICAVVLLVHGVIPMPLHAQRLLMEDFVYPPGDSLTPHGWSAGSATGPILTGSDGLQFGSYQGSGIGNAAILKATGQDVQKEFTPDSSGTIFVWALVNVSSAKAGDYFMHLQPNAGSSVYVGRTYARLASNGGLTFGVAKRGTNTAPTVVYSDSVYTLGSTYLLVLKYEFKDGSSSNDEVTLHVFQDGAVPPAEPAVPTVGPVSDATADPSVVGAIALRQGDQSRAPVLALDGIRATKGWDAWLPATLEPMKASLSDFPPGVLISWRAWTEAGVDGYFVDLWSETEGRFLPVGPSPIPAGGASGQAVDYSILDTTVAAGVARYRLRIAGSGGAEYVADSVLLDLPTGVVNWGHDPGRLPDYAGAHTHLVLTQNYPNPFNPKSVIRFVSPITEEICIALFDVLGRHHGELFRGIAEAERVYEVQIDGTRLSSGTYTARLSSPSGVAIRRMVVVR